MIYREPNEVVEILCEIYDEKFRAVRVAPKGHDIPAQGNALGLKRTTDYSPERA